MMTINIIEIRRGKTKKERTERRKIRRETTWKDEIKISINMTNTLVRMAFILFVVEVEAYCTDKH